MHASTPGSHEGDNILAHLCGKWDMKDMKDSRPTVSLLWGCFGILAFPFCDN